MLCAARLRLGFGFCVGLARGWDIGARFEVVMLADAVGTDVHVMDAALDGGLAVAANVADFSMAFAAAGANLRGFGFR